MTRWMTLLGLLLVACGDKDDPGTDSGDTGGTDTNAAFAPEEGDWLAGALSPVVDECDIFDELDGEKGGVVTLTLTSETTFSLVDEDDFAVDCTLSGRDFSCETEDMIEDYSGKGVDVVLTTTFGYSGTFDTTTSGTVYFNIDVTCEGEDCGFVTKKAGLTLPCATTASAAISRVE